MKKSFGFTLAEVLITLAIIGVVAAMTIPSVIVNTSQQEFKSGLKKAVSVLNQAITMNIALEGKSPADVADAEELRNLFTSRMNVIKTVDDYNGGGKTNYAFYTADGVRFELPKSTPSTSVPESSFSSANGLCWDPAKGAGTNLTGDPVSSPCLIVVDVNGDKSPNGPDSGGYTVPAALSSKVFDVFTLMITDTTVKPFGTVAQRTMFQAD